MRRRVQFPYYAIRDRAYMYTVGSACYGLYFIVAFPRFRAIDEQAAAPGDWRTGEWSLGQVIWDSLASCMAVTILLETWKLTVGGIDGPLGPGQFHI